MGRGLFDFQNFVFQLFRILVFAAFVKFESAQSKGLIVNVDGIADKQRQHQQHRDNMSSVKKRSVSLCHRLNFMLQKIHKSHYCETVEEIDVSFCNKEIYNLNERNIYSNYFYSDTILGIVTV